MQYKITGELAQVAMLTLSSGEACWASRGSLMSLTPGIDWTLKIPGGLGGAMRRSLSGEGISLTYVESKQDNQQVILTSNEPGKIIGWDLADGPILTTRGSFVAAFGLDIDITVVVAKRAGAALFGGAGLFLQKISGQGVVLIHGAGDFIDRQLAKEESILVSTGNLAAFAESVDYNIQSIAGCRRIFFGGEGLFMTKLTGPGRVLLQTLKRSAGASKGSKAAAGA
jgi:uncharacterized protein (TIGR00266 family)